MARKKKLEPLTETQQKISDFIYDDLNSVYCDSCRLATEISEEEAEEQYGYWGCENCHRKYSGWAISKAACDYLVRKIGEIQ